MLAEIVLSTGTDRITIGKIPALFADAIHPALREVAEREITELEKYPLTKKTKREWCGAGEGIAFPVKLKERDIDALHDGVWRDLPRFSMPMLETAWEPYRAAFESNPPNDWRLEVTHINPNTQHDWAWVTTETEYRKAIQQACIAGTLVPHDPVTLLPAPDAMGKTLESCFITVEALRHFSEKSKVVVNFEEAKLTQTEPEEDEGASANKKLSEVGSAPDDTPVYHRKARCEAIPLELLALPADAHIRYFDNIGSFRGEGHTLAATYFAEIASIIKRQAEGFFTIDEAAQILAESSGGDAKTRRAKLWRAIKDGKLDVLDTDDRERVLDLNHVRDYIHWLRASDIVAAGFIFPIQPLAVPVGNKSASGGVAPPKQRTQENRIVELLMAQGHDPLTLPSRVPGKPGLKAEIKKLALLEPALFTAKTFDTAWQRARDVGRVSGGE